MDLKSSTASTGFGQDFLIGATNSGSPPVITVPGAQLLQQGRGTAIGGVSVSETDPLTVGQTITVTLSDTNGALVVSGGGVTGNGTNNLSVTGSVDTVNAALATLTDTDGSLAADTITVIAGDSRGGVATPRRSARPPTPSRRSRSLVPRRRRRTWRPPSAASASRTRTLSAPVRQ